MRLSFSFTHTQKKKKRETCETKKEGERPPPLPLFDRSAYIFTRQHEEFTGTERQRGRDGGGGDCVCIRGGNIILQSSSEQKGDGKHLNIRNRGGGGERNHQIDDVTG
jgi:hypothetical protein